MCGPRCRPSPTGPAGGHGASNVTGWLPPMDAIIRAAHQRGSRSLSTPPNWRRTAFRPMPTTCAFSGHKLYAPFGSGALIGPRQRFETGDPFLAGGGAVDLVGLDEVIWTAPPDREEAGSPNVIGAVALHAAIEALWRPRLDIDHRPRARPGQPPDQRLGRHRGGPCPRAGRTGRAADGARRPSGSRDSAGGRLHCRRNAPRSGGRASQRRVRHRRTTWLFLRSPLCRTPPGPGRCDVDAYRDDVLRGDHRSVPGAVRASGGWDVRGGHRRAGIRRDRTGRRPSWAGALPAGPGDR